ncbi:VOC family protein [Sphingomonas sp. DT-207]|uniref:VOC family protein n=1 Tax=Sphingomonas sp. DT-207 TaxID=3396167 RepID=UPI003F19B742
MSVNLVPEGYRSVIPYLVVDDAAAAIDFYVKVFGATEVMRMEKDGKIGHAELAIGDSHIMLADEHPEMGYRGPKAFGGSAITVMVYLPDVDAAFARAIDGGATAERPVEDQFYGDRSGTFVDPFGHRWNVATHVEDVTPEEMEQRMAAMASEAG